MDRYSRQTLVYGKEARIKFRKSLIAIVGLGGTGTWIAEILARAGIGNLLLVDRDIIEETNLQRQSLYGENDVGSPKAIAAKNRLAQINSSMKIDSVVEDINNRTIGILEKYDIIMDATDNMGTRMLLNEFAKANGKHFVYSASIREQGLVAFFSPDGPCLSCIIPEPPKGGDTCDVVGVTGPAVSITGSISAHETLNYLAGRFRDTRLISVDLKNMRFSSSVVERRKSCKVCNGIFELLDGDRKEIEEICGSGFQINPENDYKLNLKHLAGHLKTHKEYKIRYSSSDVLSLESRGKEITIFKTGRMIIKNVKTEREAKILASKIISL